MSLGWPVLTVWGLSQTDLFGGTPTGILHSRDAGVTWTSSHDGNVLSVWGTSAADLYLASDRGAVFHSNNDGATWQMVLAGGSTVGAVAFGGNRGDVYGVGGSIIHSADDGQNWTSVSLPVVDGSLNLRSVWVSASGSDVFAVGETSSASSASGIVLHSADHGVSWTIELQCAGAALTSVWGASPSDVYAAGELDVVLHRAP